MACCLLQKRKIRTAEIWRTSILVYKDEVVFFRGFRVDSFGSSMCSATTGEVKKTNWNFFFFQFLGSFDSDIWNVTNVTINPTLPDYKVWKHPQWVRLQRTMYLGCVLLLNNSVWSHLCMLETLNVCVLKSNWM